ncbi:hypothetical protein COV93_07405 [Candidatus Woesearchaeota archaeon CG11_big_fil_rev_8_21_14_0_20_43_8]|nr:MAG: hypothetical protein COV93_07405 [Candidatus Woesearchaeota archaeon CG11_big_fil_rev_8_21_14_0_20_43_8]PIO06811.1 MAG: hypothetical protein COT47_02605 [Candidatus Woesearchaeota archaeon CG08_land_8_20_14_0_20_43_7]
MGKLEEITIDSYDRTVEAYAENTAGMHPMHISKIFISYLSDGASILDLGCGPGRDVGIFADRGYNVTGVDLSKKMIGYARKQVTNAKFSVMDIKSLAFVGNSFDGVWACMSFLHVPKENIEQGLGEVHRVLKPEGVFYLGLKVGNEEALKPDNRYGGVEKFWSFYQKDEIEWLLTRVGFSILESEIEKKDDTYATNQVIDLFCRK